MRARVDMRQARDAVQAFAAAALRYMGELRLGEYHLPYHGSCWLIIKQLRAWAYVSRLRCAHHWYR